MYKRLQEFNQNTLCDVAARIVDCLWADKQQVYHEVVVSEIQRAFDLPQETQVPCLLLQWPLCSGISRSDQVFDTETH